MTDDETDVANPAEALHALFAKWRQAQSGQTTPQAAREWNDPPRAAAEHRRAMGLLDAVERSIDELERRNFNVRVSRSFLVQWTQIVLLNPHAWQTPAPADNIVPPVALEQLEMLATLIDASQIGASPQQLGQIRGVVDEAIALLGDDDTLDPKLRAYLVALIREIRDALDDATIGDGYDFTRAAERLWVAMQAAGGQSPKKGGFWKAAADKLIVPIVVGSAVHATGIGVDDVAKMLGHN